ncbi:hypothetical protein ACFFJY_09140 [Fictibacillus aquaticus]|nr:hypothetical protein [Fictibacillus aquaticus]
MDKLEQHIQHLQEQIDEARGRQDNSMYLILSIRYQEAVLIRNMMKG